MSGLDFVLLAEADLSVRSVIEDLLMAGSAFSPIATSDGAQARALVGEHPFVLAILNVRLPCISGVEVCRAIQAEGHIPVILITSQEDMEEIMTGLDAGATDFVTLPIRPVELLARIRMVLSRTSAPLALPTSIFYYDDLLLDIRSHQVIKSGVSLPVTRTEIRLLAFLMRNAGQTINKEVLLREVWGYKNLTGDYNLIDSAIGRLRHSLGDDPKHPRYIHTVWGEGYRFGE